MLKNLNDSVKIKIFAVQKSRLYIESFFQGNLSKIEKNKYKKVVIIVIIVIKQKKSRG